MGDKTLDPNKPLAPQINGKNGSIQLNDILIEIARRLDNLSRRHLALSGPPRTNLDDARATIRFAIFDKLVSFSGNMPINPEEFGLLARIISEEVISNPPTTLALKFIVEEEKNS